MEEAPLCAMEMGRGNREEAEKLMGNTFSMLLITSAVLMAVGYLFHQPVLYAFGASDTTFGYARDYLLIYLAGTPGGDDLSRTESFYQLSGIRKHGNAHGSHRSGDEFYPGSGFLFLCSIWA